MKKIMIVLSACCLMPVTGFSQQTSYESALTAKSDARVVNTIIRKVKALFTDSNPLTPWAKQVKSEQHEINRNGPLGASMYALITTNYPQKLVKGEDAPIYHKRLPALMRALHQNKVIGSFKRVIVPDPHELAALEENEFNAVKSFLQYSGYEKESRNIMKPAGVTLAESGVVQVTLNSVHWKDTVFLRIDCRRQEVFLFSVTKAHGNFISPFPTTKHPLRFAR